MCSGRSRICGTMRGAICWKYSASSPLVMPSSGKRTLSGWVMVIACPSIVGIVRTGLAGDLGRGTARRFVGLVDPNTRSLTAGRYEVRLGEGADERRLAIDDRVRYAADPELVGQVREFVRFDADRLYQWRRQRHPVGQAHGPGTVGSGGRGKDHDLRRFGQLRQRCHALLSEPVFGPRDPLDGINQRREFRPRRKTLETNPRGFGV